MFLRRGKIFFYFVLIFSIALIFDGKKILAQQVKNGTQPTLVQETNLSTYPTSSTATYHHRSQKTNTAPPQEEECEIKFKPRHINGIVNYFPGNCP